MWLPLLLAGVAAAGRGSQPWGDLNNTLWPRQGGDGKIHKPGESHPRPRKFRDQLNELAAITQGALYVQNLFDNDAVSETDSLSDTLVQALRGNLADHPEYKFETVLDSFASHLMSNALWFRQHVINGTGDTNEIAGPGRFPRDDNSRRRGEYDLSDSLVDFDKQWRGDHDRQAMWLTSANTLLERVREQDKEKAQAVDGRIASRAAAVEEELEWFLTHYPPLIKAVHEDLDLREKDTEDTMTTEGNKYDQYNTDQEEQMRGDIKRMESKAALNSEKLQEELEITAPKFFEREAYVTGLEKRLKAAYLALRKKAIMDTRYVLRNRKRLKKEYRDFILDNKEEMAVAMRALEAQIRNSFDANKARREDVDATGKALSQYMDEMSTSRINKATERTFKVAEMLMNMMIAISSHGEKLSEDVREATRSQKQERKLADREFKDTGKGIRNILAGAEKHRSGIESNLIATDQIGLRKIRDALDLFKQSQSRIKDSFVAKMETKAESFMKKFKINGNLVGREVENLAEDVSRKAEKMDPVRKAAYKLAKDEGKRLQKRKNSLLLGIQKERNNLEQWMRKVHRARAEAEEAMVPELERLDTAAAQGPADAAQGSASARLLLESSARNLAARSRARADHEAGTKGAAARDQWGQLDRSPWRSRLKALDPELDADRAGVAQLAETVRADTATQDQEQTEWKRTVDAFAGTLLEQVAEARGALESSLTGAAGQYQDELRSSVGATRTRIDGLVAQLQAMIAQAGAARTNLDRYAKEKVAARTKEVGALESQLPGRRASIARTRAELDRSVEAAEAERKKKWAELAAQARARVGAGARNAEVDLAAAAAAEGAGQAAAAQQGGAVVADVQRELDGIAALDRGLAAEAQAQRDHIAHLRAGAERANGLADQLGRVQEADGATLASGLGAVAGGLSLPELDLDGPVSEVRSAVGAAADREAGQVRAAAAQQVEAVQAGAAEAAEAASQAAAERSARQQHRADGVAAQVAALDGENRDIEGRAARLGHDTTEEQIADGAAATARDLRAGMDRAAAAADAVEQADAAELLTDVDHTAKAAMELAPTAAHWLETARADVRAGLKEEDIAEKRGAEAAEREAAAARSAAVAAEARARQRRAGHVEFERGAGAAIAYVDERAVDQVHTLETAMANRAVREATNMHSSHEGRKKSLSSILTLLADARRVSGTVVEHGVRTAQEQLDGAEGALQALEDAGGKELADLLRRTVAFSTRMLTQLVDVKEQQYKDLQAKGAVDSLTAQTQEQFMAYRASLLKAEEEARRQEQRMADALREKLAALGLGQSAADQLGVFLSELSAMLARGERDNAEALLATLEATFGPALGDVLRVSDHLAGAATAVERQQTALGHLVGTVATHMNATTRRFRNLRAQVFESLDGEAQIKALTDEELRRHVNRFKGILQNVKLREQYATTSTPAPFTPPPTPAPGAPPPPPLMAADAAAANAADANAAGLPAGLSAGLPAGMPASLLATGSRRSQLGRLAARVHATRERRARVAASQAHLEDDVQRAVRLAQLRRSHDLL